MEVVSRTQFVVFFLFFFTLCKGIHDTEILNLYKQVYWGDGTYHGYSENGLCSLNTPNLPPVASRVDKLVALNEPQIFGSSACGMCLKVNGTGQGVGNTPILGAFIVYVKDVCRGCSPGDIGFDGTGDGYWNIGIQAVQCPVNGSIEYALQTIRNNYIKLQVRNDRMPTTTLLMYQPVHNTWTQMIRTTDGFWEFPANHSRIDDPIKSPVRVLLYSPTGQVLYDEVNIPSVGNNKGIIHGNGVQYSLDPNLPSA